jgi:hypothetical protein
VDDPQTGPNVRGRRSRWRTRVYRLCSTSRSDRPRPAPKPRLQAAGCSASGRTRIAEWRVGHLCGRGPIVRRHAPANRRTATCQRTARGSVVAAVRAGLGRHPLLARDLLHARSTASRWWHGGHLRRCRRAGGFAQVRSRPAGAACSPSSTRAAPRSRATQTWWRPCEAIRSKPSTP